jgi:hypothetical protein
LKTAGGWWLSERAEPFGSRIRGSVGSAAAADLLSSPVVPLVFYLFYHATAIKEAGAGKRVPSHPEHQKAQKGMRIFVTDHPCRSEAG